MNEGWVATKLGLKGIPNVSEAYLRDLDDSGIIERPDDDAGTTDAPPGEGGPPAFPPPCDPAFPLKELKCNASYPRPNCASNTTVFPSYPAGHDRANDLVTCNGGANPTCVQHCPFGCSPMPTGFPDTCDDCNGRADGRRSLAQNRSR